MVLPVSVDNLTFTVSHPMLQHVVPFASAALLESWRRCAGECSNQEHPAWLRMNSAPSVILEVMPGPSILTLPDLQGGAAQAIAGIESDGVSTRLHLLQYLCSLSMSSTALLKPSVAVRATAFSRSRSNRRTFVQPFRRRSSQVPPSCGTVHWQIERHYPHATAPTTPPLLKSSAFTLPNPSFP